MAFRPEANSFQGELEDAVSRHETENNLRYSVAIEWSDAANISDETSRIGICKDEHLVFNETGTIVGEVSVGEKQLRKKKTANRMKRFAVFFSQLFFASIRRSDAEENREELLSVFGRSCNHLLRAPFNRGTAEEVELSRNFINVCTREDNVNAEVSARHSDDGNIRERQHA